MVPAKQGRAKSSAVCGVSIYTGLTARFWKLPKPPTGATPLENWPPCFCGDPWGVGGVPLQVGLQIFQRLPPLERLNNNEQQKAFSGVFEALENAHRGYLASCGPR